MNVLSDKNALRLATQVREGILRGEPTHDIAIERLACYVIAKNQPGFFRVALVCALTGGLLVVMLAGCGARAEPPKPTNTDHLCAAYGGVASATYFSATTYANKTRIYVSVDCKDGSIVSRTTETKR